MDIKRDPIEETEKFKEIIAEVEHYLDKEFENQEGFGVCHRYWAEKKKMLAQYGIDWHSPAELNPDIIFD
jgi:hypothetical protein